MIVYRQQKQQVSSTTLLARIRSCASAELLAELGELEAAVADALCPDIERDWAPLRALREAMLSAARGRRAEALARLDRVALPEQLVVSVPEGFAQYGLFPESYAQAALEFYRESRPSQAAVIGIRSIGTTLSAVVAATLERLGCRAYSWTVRPRGHPFARRLELDAALERCWRALESAHFIVVDEGPGLSGSSFASVAERLSGLGIPDDRIVLFPAWLSDGSGFFSETARVRWQRHRKYCAEFHPFSGDLDLSAGAWRGLSYQQESRYPAVQPQHERRKFLRRERTAAFLLKFAGLGRYGRARLERARQLAEAGFGPPAIGLERGFLVSEFVPGSPCEAPPNGNGLLDRMADYLGFLAHSFPSARPVPFAELIEMIATNTAEGLGAEWAERVESLESYRAAVCDAPTVAIDARMLPYEWVRTSSGYQKTDGTDHHDDHFFPGHQDIAWDLAGAIVEFGLGPGASARLHERAFPGDRHLVQRLPFYRLAYIAYRLGYTDLAAVTLGDTADGRRFAALRASYARRLRREIQELPHAR